MSPSLALAATITGTVSPNTPSTVTVEDPVTYAVYGSAQTDANGNYTISGIPDGNYLVTAGPDGSTVLGSVYDNGATLTVSGNQTYGGVDFNIPQATVTGTVSSADTVDPMWVNAIDTSNSTVADTVYLNSPGAYSLALPQGTFEVQAQQQTVAGEVYSAVYGTPTPISVNLGNTVTGIDLSLATPAASGGSSGAPVTIGACSTSSPAPCLVSGTVTPVGGSQESLASANLSVQVMEPGAGGGLLNVDVVTANGNQELGAAFENATFHLVFETNYDPKLAMNTGPVQTWSSVQNQNGTYTVDVTAQAASSDWYAPPSGGSYCLPGESCYASQETVQETATSHYDAILLLAFDDLSSPGESSWMQGVSIGTNAQVTGQPYYTPASGSQPASLSIMIGGPHLKADLSLNTADFSAFLPQALLNEWGVQSTSQLQAAITNGSVANPVVTSEAGGMRIAFSTPLSVHTVSVSPAASTGGGTGGGSTVPSVPSGTAASGDTLDATGSATATVSNGGTVLSVDGTSLQQQIGSQTGKDVEFQSPSADSTLSVPPSAVASLLSAGDQLTLATPGVSYTLPLADTQLTQVASTLGVQSPSDVQLSVSVVPAPAQDLTALRQAVGTNGILAQPVSFTVTASANGHSVTVEQFTGLVPRTFTLSGAVNPNEATGVVLVNGVPEHARTTFGSGTATIYSMTNSTYAIVSHQVQFTDLGGVPQAAAITELADKLVTSGVTPTTFDPQGGVTREQFAALLVRGLGLWHLGQNLGFRDVAANSWAAPAIQAAVAEKLIQGFPDGTFRPNAPITNEQMAAMVARALRFLGIQPASTQVTPTDVGAIPAWARPDVQTALSQGIMTEGVGGSFQPAAVTTRAQAAQIVWNLMHEAGIQ